MYRMETTPPNVIANCNGAGPRKFLAGDPRTRAKRPGPGRKLSKSAGEHLKIVHYVVK